MLGQRVPIPLALARRSHPACIWPALAVTATCADVQCAGSHSFHHALGLAISNGIVGNRVPQTTTNVFAPARGDDPEIQLDIRYQTVGTPTPTARQNTKDQL